MDVDQRSSGIAGIDGGIRLQVDDWTIRTQLPLSRADNAQRDGVLEPQWTAERQADLPHPYQI